MGIIVICEHMKDHKILWLCFAVRVVYIISVCYMKIIMIIFLRVIRLFMWVLYKSTIHNEL